MSHPLLARLASHDPAERRRACGDAAVDPAGIVLLPALGEALGDPEARVALAAADAVAAIGARAGGVEATLSRHLRDERPHARWAAAFACARLWPPSPRLLPPLVEALAGSAREVRWRAAQLLVRCAAVVPETLPLLRGLAADDERASVRSMCLHCLREIAPGEPETAAVAFGASQDASPAVRRAALATLAGLVDPEPEVGERWVAVARGDPDAACRALAVTALAARVVRDPGRAPAAARDVLRRAAADAEAPGPRAAAARALASLAAANAAGGEAPPG